MWRWHAVLYGLSHPSSSSFRDLFDVLIGPAQLANYSSIFSTYLSNPAWYLGPNGYPVVSTFSSGGMSVVAYPYGGSWLTNIFVRLYECTMDRYTLALQPFESLPQLTIFTAWKASLHSQIYFIPDFDDTQGYYQSDIGVSKVEFSHRRR